MCARAKKKKKKRKETKSIQINIINLPLSSQKFINTVYFSIIYVKNVTYIYFLPNFLWVRY